MHHDSFKDIPKILETPYVGEDKKNKKPPYKLEIEMLKQQQFDPELKIRLCNNKMIMLSSRNAINKT